MELKEEKTTREKTIPVFTVLKNGAILKNIFIVNSRDFSSPERNGTVVSGDDEVEEILVVGRHPDCDILLTHPSISRFHLELRSIPSRQKLFVTDLSSVHGTWVTDQKVQPDASIEVKEGDVIRIGGSTRIYRLHWIPLSRAYDIDSPFVSPLDSSTAMEQEENRLLEADNLEVDHQSLGNNASVDKGDLHLDVTSEGTGSSVPSEDEDTYITTTEISLPLASLSVLTVARDSEIKFNGDLQTSTEWGLDVVEAVAEKSSTSCVPSKQQSGDYQEGLGCAEIEVSAEADEYDVKGDVGLHLNVMSERSYLAAQETSPLPLPRDTIEIEALTLTEDVKASPELAISILEFNKENPSSSFSPSNGQIDCSFEASGCSALELAAEVEILSLGRDVSGETKCAAKQFMEVPAESLTNAEIQSHEDNEETEISRQLFEVSSSFISQVEPTLGILTEEARSLVGSDFQIEVAIETGIENLHNEVDPAGSCLCFYEDVEQLGSQCSVALANLKPETQKLIGSERSEDSYNLSDKGKEGNTDKGVPDPSTLAAETFEDAELIEELPSYYTESQEHQTQQPRDVRDDELSEIDSSKRGKTASVSLLEAACCSAFGLAAEVEILSLHQEVSGETGFVTKKVMEASAETLTKTEIQSHEDTGETEVLRQGFAASPNFFPQTEPTLTRDVRGLFGSEMAIETDNENQHHKRNEETKISSSQASTVSHCLFTGNERLSRINKEDIQSLYSSWQPLPESVVGAPYEIWNEVNPAEDQNKKSGMCKESEKIFDGASSSCLSEDLQEGGIQGLLLTPIQRPEIELAIGLDRSEESYCQSELESEECTHKEIPIPSTLSAETFEDTKVIEELPSDPTGSQENKTPQTHGAGDDILSEMDSSAMRLNTCNIWSRRGKTASILQLRTNKSEGKQKQIGNQPKAQLHRKQALSDKSISHVAEELETEIFTPDKENLTPRSHMMKRLQEIGDIRDSRSSSKLSVKSSSSKIPSRIDTVTSEAFTEPEIFTPDKENLTPNSHMLKRLQAVGEIKERNGSSSKPTRKLFFDIHVEENAMVEHKPELHGMRSKPKVKKHEPVALKKKAERTPFQPLLENSSSQNQSYTGASFTASARNNISRGIRSSSNLSDAKNKMKWTIVLDTSSLLDKESRKQLHLLQGLKGTHLVVPRTVLRELNETKNSRSLLFRRRTEVASSALDWIEECKVNTKWWIQIQSQSEETKATAPTPPVTPQSTFSLSLNWNNNNAQDNDSPTSEDQVLECALLYRNRNMDEKLVLLSNDVALKIKAMKEGVICETAHEFYESLVNPFSERFMWRESLPIGRTWSHLDDVVLKERYNNKSAYNGGGRRGEIGVAAKGLKLILLHNSHYCKR